MRNSAQGTVCFPTTDRHARAAAYFSSSRGWGVRRFARWVGSVVGKPPLLGASRFALVMALAGTAHGLDIQLRPDAALAGNAAALAAFERAVATWERIFDDPIVIKIDAHLLLPDTGLFIASTESVTLFGDNYAEIRDAMLLDDAQEGGSIVQALPTFAQLTATLPPGAHAVR